jgi:hypothetical protein
LAWFVGAGADGGGFQTGSWGAAGAGAGAGGAGRRGGVGFGGGAVCVIVRAEPFAVARSINSGMEERTVSSAGSLALASKSKSPSAHARAVTTASSPAAPSPTAWKRWPKRKYRVVAPAPFWRRVSVPVARSA